MAKKKKEMVEVTEGQTVYVWNGPTFLNQGKTKRELREYVVTKFNKSSIYAKEVDSEYDRETRFDRKTMSAKTGFGGAYYLYTNPDVFYEAWDRRERVAKLRETTLEKVKKATEEQLNQINELLKN
ncbi:beta barrel domain-containing protein [Rossellomorea marisflavi]|uniref:beta barrel domain-containing protein n=1 Tax=Rossellomorea marisflavi TaxID=189381 RepID=UPI003F9F4199